MHDPQSTSRLKILNAETPSRGDEKEEMKEQKYRSFLKFNLRLSSLISLSASLRLGVHHTCFIAESFSSPSTSHIPPASGPASCRNFSSGLLRMSGRP